MERCASAAFIFQKIILSSTNYNANDLRLLEGLGDEHIARFIGLHEAVS
jgi:hypothetical protein